MTADERVPTAGDERVTTTTGERRASAGGGQSGGAPAEGASAGGALSALHRDGYLVLRDVLDPGDRRRMRAELTPLLGPAGRDPFRSRHIRRVYGVLHNTRAADPLIDHPRVLALLDRLLLPNYLLSQLEVVEVGRGAPARPPGYDDQPYPLPRPRPALSVAALWTLDAGTVLTVWPGSHRWPAGDPATPGVSLAPPPGSCVILLGTLWHARPPQPATSLTVTAHYCEPWLRTREAFALSPGRHVARQLSSRARRMLGYSIHPPDLGLVDGVHPYRLFS
ncbi:phytanoyl-CoA dioxygenase family protein [[Actinomadura] parvosata]|uniref:phytanoyl-CoA dioxygenase family protein n=1 Tax=[Actinomadura] parvosata TaxID=1955412 RepID=UPI00406C6D0D